MAREISISFSLGAVLSSSFKGAFQNAQAAARNVGAALRAMESAPTGKLGASIAQQREKLKNYANSLKEAKATLASLQAQQAAGNGTKMLARQIAQAEARVSNLSGALKRQGAIWRETMAQAATAGGSVRKLAADYEKLEARMARLRRVQQNLHANRAVGEALRAQRGELQGRMAGAMAAGATVAVPAKLSIDFEQAIADVGAVANASDEDLKRLTDTARQLGRDTMFSASQAAEGMKYLAMAGFDTNDTIAAMPGMLQLSAAGNVDLGRTADIASDILSAFKMRAEEMGDVSDTLAKTFTTSNTSLEMLGDTMKYVGPVAASVGMSLQDTSAMAGMLGNVGIKASQAGTVLRAALLRLSAPPKMAKEALGELAGVAGPELDELYEQIGDVGDAKSALENLGMTTRDQAGNLRPMIDILEELNARTAQMGSAEKAEVFKNIFGTEASAGMIALAEQAAVTVDKFGNQIVDAWGKPTNALRAYMGEVNNFAGTGARISEKRMATTHGALLLLSSAWQDAGISIGNLFLPAIQSTAGILSTVANVISGFTERFPVLSKVVALTVGGFLALTAASVGFGLAVNFARSGLNSARGAILRIGAAHAAATVSTAANTAATGAFGIAAKLAGLGAKFFAGGLRSILLASGVGALLVGLGFGINYLIDNWDGVVATMRQAWQAVTETWTRLGVFFSELGSNLLAVFGPIWDRIVGVATWAKDLIVSYWTGLLDFYAWIWNGIVAGATWLWDGAVSIFNAAYDAVTGYWATVVDFFSGIWADISASATSAYNGICIIWDGIVAFFGGIGEDIFGSVGAVWQTIADWASWAWGNISGIWNSAVGFFDGIIASIRSFFSGFFDWLKDKFSWVLGTIDFIGSTIDGITGAVGKAWNAAFGEGGEGDEAAKAATTSSPDKSKEKQPEASQPQKPEIPSRPERPASFTPVSRQAVAQAGKLGADKNSGRSGRKSGSSGKSRSGGSRSDAASDGSSAGRSSGDAGANPVTVVTLDSGNQIRTQYFPAPGSSTNPIAAQASEAAKSPLAARIAAPSINPDREPGRSGGLMSQAMTALKSGPLGAVIGKAIETGQDLLSPQNYILPDAPQKIARVDRAGKSGQQPKPENSISIDLTQNFDLIASDVTAARKVLEAIKPDMEALVRKALAKIQSDRSRTTYAQ